jgi:hypothetical protein
MLKRDIADVYRSAFAFVLACPLLFAIPALVEFAQHVVELQAGMYVSEAGARAAEADPLRLQFGFAKTMALLLPGYWFTRYVMFGHDPRRAARIEWPAFGLWLVIFVVSAAEIGWALFGPSPGELLGAEGTAATGLSAGRAVLSQIVLIYLSALVVAWPLGNGAIGPIRSAAIMHGSFWYAIALAIASLLPLMALHYALAIVAVIWLPVGLDWTAMAIDSLLVGYLALTLTGGGVYAARRAAGRKGVTLLAAQAREDAPV